MNKHFWNWARDETNPEERTLLLGGADCGGKLVWG